MGRIFVQRKRRWGVRGRAGEALACHMLTHNERAVEVRIEQLTRKEEAGGAVHAKNESFAPELT